MAQRRKRLQSTAVTVNTADDQASASGIALGSQHSAAEPLAPSEEAIRQRAYELYQARNGQGGDAVSDWHEAERELRQLSRI